jgi:hypothetical protein
MTVRLRFVEDGPHDLVARVIRGAQMGLPWSHVEAVTPEGPYLGSRFAGGVQARQPSYDTEWVRQLFVDVPATVEQEAAFWAFLTSKIGLPYDDIAICEMAAGALLGTVPEWDVAIAYICSAAQAAALLSAEFIKEAPAGIRLATPRDVLAMCGTLTTIGPPQTRIIT